MKIADKSKSLYGLSKVPDKALIKDLRIQIGILNSEIDELKDKLSKSSSEINKSASVELRKEERYKQMTDQITSLNTKLSKSRKDNSLLLCRLSEKDRVIDDLRAIISKYEESEKLPSENP